MAIHKLTYWEEQINSIQWDKQQPNMTQPCCVEKWLTKGFKYAHTVRYILFILKVTITVYIEDPEFPDQNHTTTPTN